MDLWRALYNQMGEKMNERESQMLPLYRLTPLMMKGALEPDHI